MRVGAILSPVADWTWVLEAARAADAAGLDAVGFWDHYHSAQPEWAYVCGWSAYGAVAAVTERVRLVPMVLNNLHYDLGVLAKETAVLAHASGGRFELGIGAGDWPESFAAWGEPFPPPEERVARLGESIAALRALWGGLPVTRTGSHVRLDGAISTPTPPIPPRVVVGVGKSRRALEVAARVADEANLYADEAIVAEARARAVDAPRPMSLSLFVSWEWDNWPSDPYGQLAPWQDRGIDRAYVSIGSDEMTARVDELARIAERVAA